MKKVWLLVLTILFLGNTVQAQIISQYIETNSGTTPKGIEIWNNTGSTLDFSSNSLVIKKGVNGAALAEDYTLSSGTLAPGDVLVIGTSDLQTTTINNGSAFYEKSFTFNGDDALSVEYGGTTTDIFGNPGNDPGTSWAGNGVSTTDQNIELKSGITTGDLDGWTDPSERFGTVNTDPSGTGGDQGFGIAPTNSSNTSVQFALSSSSVNEGDGTYDLDVSIANPDGTNPTSVDVVLISGDASDIGNYTAQTVTFAAGSSIDETVTINITDDSELETDEDFIFELQNVSGGNSATISSPSQFTLTIMDNDVPKVIISEIMQNPSAALDDNGEWIELYNDEESIVNIDGWKIKDNGTDEHTINNGGTLNIPSKGFIVLGINDDTGLNGNVNLDYKYTDIQLANGDDEVIITLPDDTEVDRVEYDGGPNWPDPTGASMYFNGTSTQDNNVGSNWSTSTIAWSGSSGDAGSPGYAGESPLPVELSSFTASVVNNSVMLNWRTETEVDNYGFEIERASLSASPRQVWEKIGFVNGSGNSNAPVSYTFTDENVQSGKYSYRLKQIDTDGDYEYSEVIEVDLGMPEEFELAQNFPNPFNPVTKIKYTIPSVIASETKQSLITIKVYDILGNEVATLVNEFKPAGSYEVEFSGSNLASGMYFYQLKTENFTTVKKMILTK